jgi:hypothetical protein
MTESAESPPDNSVLSVADVARDAGVSTDDVIRRVVDHRLASLDHGELLVLLHNPWLGPFTKRRLGRSLPDVPLIRKSWAEAVSFSAVSAPAASPDYESSSSQG